ncbi:MAG: NAD(+) synthase, partial [Candidatus Thermoplasmatota archaeon]|nr:NAD(+) synthase [Candidatus Thermoplasmatota archaeon]
MHEEGLSLMRIALLQADPTVGDLAGNAKRLLALVEQSKSAGAAVAVSTELAITGYPPRDLLMSPDFVQAAFEKTQACSPAIPTLIGTPVPGTDREMAPANGVVAVGEGLRGKVVAHKQLLPTYDVFDEARYFRPGSRPGLVRGAGGMDLGITVCEDAWQAAGLTPVDYGVDPVAQLAALVRQDATLSATVNLSASPFHHAKVADRITVARTAAARLGTPFLLANQVGGNDDLVFDGSSIAAWPDGTVVLAPSWAEGVLTVDLNDPSSSTWTPSNAADALSIGAHERLLLHPDQAAPTVTGAEGLVDAVVTGLADYCRKSGLHRIVLGLSGGIDSAVAACVAVEALGPEAVHGLALPSRHSSQHSRDDARWTAEALGMRFSELHLDAMHQPAETLLGDVLRTGHAVAGENLQARLRALLVMGHANAEGAMAIATGNKSELAQGYCTLYGDMAGGYAPLGDLWKMDVYAMADVFNARARAQGRDEPVNA